MEQLEQLVSSGCWYLFGRWCEEEVELSWSQGRLCRRWPLSWALKEGKRMQWASWDREQHKQSSRNKSEGGSQRSASHQYSDGQDEDSLVLLNSFLCAVWNWVGWMERKLLEIVSELKKAFPPKLKWNWKDLPKKAWGWLGQAGGCGKFLGQAWAVGGKTYSRCHICTLDTEGDCISWHWRKEDKVLQGSHLTALWWKSTIRCDTALRTTAWRSWL